MAKTDGTGPLLGWVRSLPRGRKAFFLPLVILAVSAGFISSVGWLVLGDLVPTLDGRFGNATGRFGPVPAAHVRSLDTDEVGLRCSQPVQVNSSPRQVEFVTSGGNTSVVQSIGFLEKGQRPEQAAEVAISSSVARRLNIQLGGSIELDASRFTVVGLMSNPDRRFDDAVFGTSQATGDEAVCYILSDTRSDAQGLLGTQVMGATWWPRSSESVSASLQVVLAVLAVLLAICTAALLMTGFFVLGSDLTSEFATLFALGVTPRQLRATLTAPVLVFGITAGVAGFMLSTVFERLTRSWLVAQSGVVPHGGLSGLGHGLALATAVGGLVAGLSLAACFVPIQRSINAGLAQQMSGAATSRTTAGAKIQVASATLITVGVIGASISARPGSLMPFAFATLVLFGGIGAISGLVDLGLRVASRGGFRSQLAAEGIRTSRLVSIPVATVSACLIGLTMTAMWFSTISQPAIPTTGEDQLLLSSLDNWNADLPGSGTIIPSGGLTEGQLSALHDVVGLEAKTATLLALQTDPTSPSFATQVQWLADARSLGGSGMNESFTVTAVPLYVDTDELADALGIEARPVDDTDVIEIRTGMRGNMENLLGVNSAADTAVLYEPGLKTTVSPAALISQHDASLLEASLVDVGQLVAFPAESDSDTTILMRFADENGLYHATTEPGKGSIESQALLIFGPVLLVLSVAAGFTMVRSGLESRIVIWKLGSGRVVAVTVEGLKLAILVVASLLAGGIMASAGPLALRGEGVHLALPTQTIIVVMGVSFLTIVGPALVVARMDPFREVE